MGFEERLFVVRGVVLKESVFESKLTEPGHRAIGCAAHGLNDLLLNTESRRKKKKRNIYKGRKHRGGGGGKALVDAITIIKIN